MKKSFLPFPAFADKWIEENVSSEYTDMKDDVRGFVALVIRQNHSGGSFGQFLAFVSRLMDAYYAQLDDRS